MKRPFPFRRPTPFKLVTLGAVAVLGVLLPVGASGFTGPSAVTDINPNDTPAAPYGGRVNALTIDPVNTQIAYAGSELGGLWRTDDGGLNWSHVDAVPLTVVEDVEIAPSDSNLVIATGDYGGETPSKGGIWRSTDGGVTWSKPATSDCFSQATTTGIAMAPGTPGSIKVWVGDSCGLAYSANSGATWAHFVPSGMTGRVWDVAARQDGTTLTVDACGDSGGARSTSGGATAGSFTAYGTNPLPAGGFMPCTIDTAPQNANIIFTTHYKGVSASGFCQPEFLQSTDGGATWTDMALEDDNCRNPWVVTHPALNGMATKFDVFEGTGNKVRHQLCDQTTGCLAGTGNWPQADSGAHADPSDIAFDTVVPNGCPRLLSTDGGVYRTTVAPASCATSFAYGESSVGLHALDIVQMAGTVNAATTDLYAATQDNGIYYTGDGGATYTRQGPDVYAVYADHNPPARVLWRPCFGCSVLISNPGVTGTAGFPVPPGDDVPNNFDATQFGHQSYAFITHDAPNPPPPAPANPNWTLYVTTNEGGAWAQMGPDPLPGIGPSGPLMASGPAATPTFYFMVRNGGTGRNEIYRLAGPFDTTPVPALASNGLFNPSTFAVDPSNPLRLYAFDILGPSNGKVMSSTNGGASWTEDVGLDSLITRGGTFATVSNAGALVTAIGFDGNSDTILVGTLTAGLWASADNGADWFNVRGGEQLPRSVGFFFDERTGAIYASTQGRGIWRIDAPHSDLSIAKTDSPDPVIAGQKVTYTITVSNAGPDVASGIVVRDTLPSQTTYVTSSGASCTEGPTGTLTCPLPSLASGASESFQIQALVKSNTVANAAPGVSITNTATVNSSEALDGTPANNTATASTIVNESADLAVSKTCDATVPAGGSGTCTIFVDNQGPSDARGVMLTDALLSDGFFTITSTSPAGPTCTATSGSVTVGTVSCNLGTIQAATTSTPGRKTVVVTISASEGQTINDTASVRADTPDPNNTNDQANSAIPVTALADLSLTKTAAPNPVIAGQNLTYTVTVTNNGPSAAANLMLTDNEPSAVTILSVSAPGSTVCNAGVPGDASLPTKCTFGSVASGASRTMTIVTNVKPDAGGTIHDDARASSDTLDPNLGNNLAHTDTTVNTQADLATTKTASPSPTVVAGRALNYRIRVTNNGPSTARSVTLSDPLPAGITFTGASVVTGSGSCVLVAGPPAQVHCELGDLAPTGYAVVSIDSVVNSSTPDGTTLSNTATAGSATPDPSPGNNSATATNTVQAVYDRSIVLTSDSPTYKPSTTIHYLITVADAGPSDAVGVVVTQVLPPLKTGNYVSDDGGCTLAGNTLTCPVGVVAAGASRAFHVDFYVQGSKGTVTSTASLNADAHDPVSGNDTSTRDVLRK